VILSVLTGFRVLPGPDLFGIVLAFYSLFLLPGYLIDLNIVRLETGVLERVCRIFSLGLLYAAVIVCFGLIPGVGYASIMCLGAAFDIALLLLDGRRRLRGAAGRAADPGREGRGSTRGERLSKVALLVLLFAAGFIFFLGSGELDVNSDSLDHVSFLRRSLDSGLLFPNDSFYRDGDGTVFDPRKGIFHPVLALWSYQSDAPPDLLWSMVPSFFAFFACAAFCLFASTLLGSSFYTIIALCFLLLFYRGEGVDWLTKTGFSRNISQIVLWCAAAFLLRYYDRGRRELLAIVALLTAAGTAFHLVYALLFGVFMMGLFIYVRFTKEGKEWLGRFVVSLPFIIIALALPLVIRMKYTMTQFNDLHTHRQGMLVIGDNLAVIDPVEAISRVGLVFLYGIVLAPFIFAISPARKQRLLVGILFLLPVILVLNPLTAVLLERQIGYLHYRLLYAAPLMCLLALGITGLFRILVTGRSSAGNEGSSGKDSKKRSGLIMRGGEKGGRGVSAGDRAAALGLNIARRLAAAAMIALFVLYPLRFAADSFSASIRTLINEQHGTDPRWDGLIESLDNAIPGNSVIVSDPGTSYILSAFTDHYVMTILDQHSSPADPAVYDRLSSAGSIMSPVRPLSADLGSLERYGAEYILLDMKRKPKGEFFLPVIPGESARAYEKFTSCPEILRELFSINDFALFEIDRESLAQHMAPACSLEVIPLDRYICDAGMENAEPVYDIGAGLKLARLEFGSDRYAPGDTVTLSLCWTAADEISFGLPIAFTVRLDTDFPQGSFFRAWYGKQYRRIIERRNWTIYRLTASERVRGGYARPEMWPVGRGIHQECMLVLPEWIAPGRYLVRLTAQRLPYIPNRTIADYLRNEDSLSGTVVASIEITAPEK
jgi:hypothetical protein